MADEKKLDIVVLELPSSPERMRAVLERRLAFVDKTYGVEPGSIVQISDAGYQAIAELTHNNPGFALEVVKRLVPRVVQSAETFPCVITEEHVHGLGYTYERLSAYWASPFKGVEVVYQNPWYQR